MINLTESQPKKPNKLIQEKSPYLLQHSYNPVEWYPWGPEAFEKAEKEDKPIFLSIGYSTCHWCHVMERESFEDTEVAKLMNDAFISIKVDREERPDIDKIYMAVCQAMTGRGGWPLTIIMTPTKKPFFAATYIPKRGRFGSSGMLELISEIKDHWKNKRQEVLTSADTIFQALQQVTADKQGQDLSIKTLAMAYTQLLRQFDEKDGGFSDAPKFPTPHIILFLLRYWKRTGSDKALQMVEKTLQSMRLGGIFDQIGFGFHRYSTDYFWLLPHFEKMLYDQAMLAMAYTETYQATKNKTYEKTVHEILTYVLRHMTDSQGGFYSAEDADSPDEEGRMMEGKFYVWTEEELRKVLETEEADLILKLYNVKKGGNFLEQATQQRTGENILHLGKSIPELAVELSLPSHELEAHLEEIRKKLFTARGMRPTPHKDDKILTNWNGLMIAAFAKAARTFQAAEYTDAAQNAVNFIFNEMQDSNGRLLHRYRDGEAAILANIDDHAFLIWGLLELYETTFDPSYLLNALKLNEELMQHFWDAKEGGFYFTPDDGEKLLFRQKEIYDGAIPSGNSVAMLNLIRLGQITGQSVFIEQAERIGKAFAPEVTKMPSAFTQLMVALEFALSPSCQVIIAGDSHTTDTKQMISALRNQYFPNKIVLLNPSEQNSPEIFQVAEYVKDQPSLQGKATAYVCINDFCKKPVTDVDSMLQALEISTGE